MTEPTDHRAEAEQWIALANTEGHDEQMTGVVPALLAIAHDLHRIADASDGLNRAINALMAIAGEASRIADALEPKTINMLAPVRSANPHGASMRPMHDQADDQPGPGNVEADFTEDGQLIRPAGEPQACEARWGTGCPQGTGRALNHRCAKPEGPHDIHQCNCGDVIE